MRFVSSFTSLKALLICFGDETPTSSQNVSHSVLSLPLGVKRLGVVVASEFDVSVAVIVTILVSVADVGVAVGRTGVDSDDDIDVSPRSDIDSDAHESTDDSGGSSSPSLSFAR